jgi:hypothetical protein
MARKDVAIFAGVGFVVWLSGVFLFRLGGRLMLESGPLVLLASALGVAASVCFLLKATMDWRKARVSDAVSIAVVMALPGLFGDSLYVPAFSAVTGAPVADTGAFAGLIIFGNAALLAYALFRARQS